MELLKSKKEIIKQTKARIDQRRSNPESLQTRWKLLNYLMLDGIEPNCIITLAGRSGAGKSSVGTMIEDDIITLNKDKNVAVLNFSLEMTGVAQMLRKLSGKMKCSTRALNSVGITLSEEKRNQAFKLLDEMGENDDIFTIEEPIHWMKLLEVTKKFIEFNPKKWVVIVIDHAGLVRGNGERDTLIALQKALIEIKKLGKTSILQLAQLNREIESPQRKEDRYQYPNKGDIMGSDALYQASDYVMVIHRPESLLIEKYGPMKIDTKKRVFLHILKNREGEEHILVFEQDYRNNNMHEMGMIEEVEKMQNDGEKTTQELNRNTQSTNSKERESQGGSQKAIWEDTVYRNNRR